MSATVVRERTYYLVFAALLFLTGATVSAALLPLSGLWHAAIGLSIAAVKATLVVLFFMHALYSDGLTRVFIVGGFLWLGILFVLTLSDYVSRDWLPVPGL